jgi:hypothetical protein
MQQRLIAKGKAANGMVAKGDPAETTCQLTVIASVGVRVLDCAEPVPCKPPCAAVCSGPVYLHADEPRSRSDLSLRRLIVCSVSNAP